MALALAVQPLAAQAKQSNSSGVGTALPGATLLGASSVAAGAAAVNESDLLIPDSGTSAAGTRQGAGTGSAAVAQGSRPAGSVQPGGAGVSTWDFVRMLIILAGVVGVIYLLFWLLRRGSGKKIQENDLIRVLGSRSLAGNRALHLVEVGGSVYLVGASDGGVGLIAEITDKESLDSVRLKAAEENPAARRNFAQILTEIFRPAKRPPTLGDGIGFLKGQRERLKKL
jgi:flagellar biosynthetic protein FliO